MGTIQRRLIMTNQDQEPVYSRVELPSNKDPREYDWRQRRGELYKLIEQAGHPRSLSRTQRELAQRYGVSQSQIFQDIQRIKAQEAERIGDGAEANTQFVLQKAVRGLLEQGKLKDAAQTQLDYYEWLFDTGTKEKAAEETHVTGDPLVVMGDYDAEETPGVTQGVSSEAELEPAQDGEQDAESISDTYDLSGDPESDI